MLKFSNLKMFGELSTEPKERKGPMSTDVSVFDRQKAAAFGLVLKVLQSVFGAEPVLDRSMRCAKIPSRKLLPFLGLGGNEAIACAMDQFLTDENDFQRIGEGYYRLFVSPSLEVSSLGIHVWLATLSSSFRKVPSMFAISISHLAM